MKCRAYSSSENLQEFVCDFILISVHLPFGVLDLYTVHACFHSHCSLLCPSDCILAYHSFYAIFIKISIVYMHVHVYVCVNVVTLHRILCMHVLTIALYGETMGWLFMKKGDIV